jgi:2-polyprenyl-3-methyl-5-hydroxy-6-metoxy-1,4-benzoquinol methylase
MSNYTENGYVPDPNTPWFKIVQNIEKDSVVLDVGCSSGHLGEVIKRETGSSVVGIEIDADDANRARKLLDAVYEVNLEHEAAPEQIRQQKFDYIIFCDVIEHFVNPVAVLEKIKPLLKPTGKVLFSIPNMAHMSVRLMVLGGKFAYGETGLLDKTHLHYYDQDEIHRIFAEAGYTMDKFDWVARDYPKELLTQELEKLGLKPTEKFLKTRNENSAAAYQYVGVAMVAQKAGVATKRTHVSPDIHDLENYVKGLQDERDFLAHEKDEMAHMAGELRTYAESLQTQLHNTIGHRLRDKTEQVIKRIKR